jgi:DNA-binding HxlR family transcriptional regulator
MIDLAGIDPKLHDAVTALAADMRAHGYQRDDPVREVFALLGDRWTTLILLVLDIGLWRHAELRRVLGRLAAEGKISQRVLTLKLRALERDGIVRRHATADVPPMVSYELSDLGRSLIGEARRLMAWVHAHRVQIESARSAFEANRLKDGGRPARLA